MVDDYYSSIKKDDEEKSSSWSDSKPKVRAKKKIVVKKAPVKWAKTANENKTIPQKKTVAWWEKKSQKSKQFVQKIEVVKKEDRVHKKDSVVSRSSDIVNERTSNWVSEAKKNFKPKKTFSNTSSSPKSEWGNEKVKRKKSYMTPQKTRGRLRGISRDDEFSFSRWNKLAKKKKEEKKVEDIVQNLTERTWEVVVIPDVLSLKEFSEKIGVILPKLMAEFMKNGVMVNINSKVDFETASIVSEAFDIKVERDSADGVNVEDIMTWDITQLLVEDDPSKLKLRSPVISIMWHVDHGKTSLLDYIRKSKVTAGEAGWITQSIGAYQVEHDGGKITFLDTPGHEAFTVMRARGAKSTDIAILVVAADEWVKPQTIESINHAKEADIPVVVAINKMDKEWANPDHVKGQLAEHGLVPEDWWGDTPMVPVSAHSWFGIDELLEIILLVAEMKELKANPDRAAIATIIESHLDQKLGPVATILINTGTLNKWDTIVCSDSSWKIKVLKDYTGKAVKFWIPWEPVFIVGLDKVVEGWDILQVVSSPEIARQKASEYKDIIVAQKARSASGLDLLMSKIKAGNLKQLKIVLKADTNGALEAMKWSLLKLSTPETTVSIIHSWVGNITESDILMSEGSQAILIGFSVWVLSTAKGLLDNSGVEYINSDIIYHITERIEKIVTWMLDPKEVEVDLGRAKVGGIFYTDKDFLILGLNLFPESKIEAKAQLRVIRNKKMIGAGVVDSLKQWTVEVKELEGPIDCGIKFVWNAKIEEWDTLEIYKIEIQK